MILDLSHDAILDGTEELKFTIPAADPKAYLLALDGEIEWRSRRFYIAEIERDRRGNDARIVVTAAALWQRLADRTRVGSFLQAGVTVAAGLEAILDGTGWTVAPATTDNATVYSIEEQDQTVLSLLHTWAQITSTYLTFNTATREVKLGDRGIDRGVGFRYGRNLRGMRKRERPPEATVLYPYGRDGLHIAGLNAGKQYLEDFTYYTDLGLSLPEARERYTRERVWHEARFLVDTELYEAATELLAETAAGIITYELDVVDISELTGIAEDLELGDTVRVSDPAFNEDVRTTVVRIERFPLEPWRNRIELAYNYTPTSTSSASRPNTSDTWEQFYGRVKADYRVREDGIYTVARIPLNFREGGRANYHVDLELVGVGAGVATISVYDAVDDRDVFRTLDVAYTDGETIKASLDFASFDLISAHDYRVRVTTVADGGPSASKGVNIAADAETEASFYIMAVGATQQTPTAANSVVYNYTGTVQTWTVPDNVEEATFTVNGAAGAGGTNSPGGNGGMVKATFPVVPGTVYDVYVGGEGNSPAGGWPNGGQGVTANNPGSGGGGASYLVEDTVGAAVGITTDALIVAAGGGGGSDANYAEGPGGDGGYYEGTDGYGGGTAGPNTGSAATQWAPGNGLASDEAGDTDGQGHGGDGGAYGAIPAAEGGGGGGGYHGGGSGTKDAAAGGGGSGFADPSGFDLELGDGTISGDGSITIEWETID